MRSTMWWGYLHSNGTIQVKRWFGDHEDYTGDCAKNPFVQKVVPPFEAETQEKAVEIIIDRLNNADKDAGRPSKSENSVSLP